MKKFALAAALSAVAALGAAPGAASAVGLIGDQVTVALTIGGFPAFLCSGCTQNFTVGAGQEGAIFNNTQAIDFGAYSFSISSAGSFTQFGFNPAPANRPVSLRLSGLDFGAPLTDVSFTTLLTGPVTRTVGTDFVQFDFFDQAIPNGAYIQATFIAGATAVPEPATYGLMLAGIGVMGFIARRRKS